jgi:hypothetical protein
MTAKNTPVNAAVSDDDGFTTVSEARIKMTFNEDGDVWEGFYEGPETVIDPNTGEEYPYLTFRDLAGDGYTVSASYQLATAFAAIAPGTYARITRTGTTPVKRGLMTNFKVQTRSAG